MFATLRAWAALTDKIKIAISEALDAHTKLEDQKWSEIERRLTSLEHKVDRLLLRDEGE